VNEITESALGDLVNERLDAKVRLVDPDFMLNTSNCGDAVITNRKFPPESRVIARAVSPALRVAAVVGPERLPLEATL
jgi:hypothetical protein